MAGFLGIGNYSKPGRGVGKDEPQKKRFFLFFELYARKFWKLAEINMLYFVFCIPFLIPFLLASMTKSVIVIYLSFIPFIGIAAVTSGFVYILRNFAREEPAFLWMDFIDTIKKNWRQSLSVGAIDLVVYFLMIFAIMFYHGQLGKNNLIMLPYILCIVFTIIFTFMQFYLLIMVITFDLSVKQIFRNAFIFTFAGFGHNILITLYLGILALILYIVPFLLFLTPFILISTIGFIIVFNVWPIIEKYMIPEVTSENQAEDKSLFEDNGRED